MDIMVLVVAAMIGEAVWETLKPIWENGKLSIDRIGALIIGIFIAVASGLDIMKLVGIPMSIPYAGLILTGLLISRGANFMHDILASIGNVRVNTKK